MKLYVFILAFVTPKNIFKIYPLLSGTPLYDNAIVCLSILLFMYS